MTYATERKIETPQKSVTNFLFSRGTNETLTQGSEAIARLVIGLFLVPHGAQKLFGWFGGYGLDATGQFFEQQLGFSNGFLVAFSAGFIEFFAGLALAFGLFTRLSALGAAVLLFVASTIHLQAGFFWTGGGYEYPILWAVVAASFIFRGGNRFSLDAVIYDRLHRS